MKARERRGEVLGRDKRGNEERREEETRDGETEAGGRGERWQRF